MARQTLPCPKCNQTVFDLSKHLHVEHSMEKKRADRMTLALLLSDCDKENRSVKCNICSLTVVNNSSSFRQHMEKFHGYTIKKALQVIQDEERITQERQKNGFTDIEGQCGFCMKIQEPGSNYNRRFKSHLRECRDQVDKTQNMTVESTESGTGLEICPTYDEEQPQSLLETVASPSCSPTSVQESVSTTAPISKDSTDLHSHCVNIDELQQIVERLDKVETERNEYKRIAFESQQELKDLRKQFELYKRCMRLLDEEEN